MKPSIGQRWQYINDYIVEIIEVGQPQLREHHQSLPGVVKIKVLQKLKPDGSWILGEVFSPANLDADGPRQFWTFLEGQDAPK